MKLHIILASLTIGTLLPFAFNACSSNLPDAVTQNSSAGSTLPTITTVDPSTAAAVIIVTGGSSASSTSTLTLAVSSATPAANTTITLSAAGGTPPYIYSKTGGAGTLSGSTYITPSVSESVIFKVTDSTFATATIAVSVTAPTTKQIYQYYFNGTHFYTTANDAYVNGINPDGPAYKLLVNSTNDGRTKLVYRCVIPNTALYFETNSSNCEGNWSNANLGWSYVNQEIGTIPLYRYACGNDHVDSTSTSVNGCNQEGLLGYVPAP